MSDPLWFVIYSAGVIGGFAGPLPYDMSECLVRRDEMRQSQADGLASGVHHETGKSLTEEEIAGVSGLSFECEYRAVKPNLGDPKPSP